MGKKYIIFVLVVFYSLTAFAQIREGGAAHRTVFNADGYKVTSLSDGLLAVPFAAYVNHKNQSVSSIIKKVLLDHHVSFQRNAFLISDNVFLIQHAKKNILVDTGAGDLLPPKNQNGFLQKSLNQIGVKDSQINVILLTHLHPDHIGGLITKNGQARFKNATLYINQDEWRYWHSEKESQQAIALTKPWFALVSKITKSYKGHVHLFKNKKQQVLPHIYAIPLPGHTPGHTGYLLNLGENKKLLFCGDIAHSNYFAFLFPKWHMIFDVLPQLSIKTRLMVLKWTSGSHIPIAGPHLTFPGVGFIHAVKHHYVYVALPKDAMVH